MTPGEDRKLTEDEVDVLLRATEEDEEDAPVASPGSSEPLEPSGPSGPAEPVRRINAYDFQQPNRFSKAELEELRVLNEDLIRDAAEDAGLLLRTNVKVQLVSMDQMKWENLLEEVDESSVALTFSMPPFTYQGLLTVDRTFAIACLDTMMGGGGEPPDVEAELTELDMQTFRRFARVFTDPLPAVWGDIGEFLVEMGERVTDLEGLDAFTPEDDLFQLSFLVQSPVASGQVHLSLPFEAVRLLPRQGNEADGDQAGGSHPDAASAAYPSLARANVDLSVVLGMADIKVSDLVAVAPGDVIVLDTCVGDALTVRVNAKAKLRGLPGLVNGKLAVKMITEG